MSHVHDEVRLTKTYIYLQKESKFRNSKLTITCFTSKIKYFALFKVGEVKISCLLSFIYPFGYEGSLYNFDGEAVNSLKACIFSCIQKSLRQSNLILLNILTTALKVLSSYMIRLYIRTYLYAEKGNIK